MARLEPEALHVRLLRHALVTGKFYPPHLGHLHLITSAALSSDHVTVVVLGSSRETLSIADRVAWLRRALSDRPSVRVEGILDDLPIDYGDDAVWRGHVALMLEAVAAADARGPYPPLDAVFSSEAYGQELGSRLGVFAVVLDPGRVDVPVSGTRVRADVPGHWHLIPPSVQAGLCLRVVMLGSESTGTTTLCGDLATRLQQRGGAWSKTRWEAEYGREYSAALTALARADNPMAMPADLDWSEEDFLRIAREQTRREEAAAEAGGPCLLLDTDALATTVWHERYRGCSSPALESLAGTLPRRDLYVLTSPEGVAFEQDSLRDGEHLRLSMHERFRQILGTDREWVEVSGDREARVRTVLDRIDALAARRWTFTPPIAERKRPQAG